MKTTHALFALSLIWMSAAQAQTVPASPDIDTLRKAAGSAQFTDKKPAEAIELWSRLLQLKPDDNQALRLRGSAYGETGQHDLAERDGLRATELEPGNSNAWNSLCWGRILANRPLEARPACEKGVSLDASSMAATVNLGHTYLLAGDIKQAQGWYQKTLPLIDSEEQLKDGPLADFDIFIGKGWQAAASKEGRAWFETQGKVWIDKKLLVVELLTQANAAVEIEDYTKAAAALEQSLPLLKDVFGENHTRVARVQKALVDIAFKLANQSLAGAEVALHPAVLATIMNQFAADQSYKQGRYADALPLYREVLKAKEVMYSTESSEVVVSLNDVANTLQAMGAYAEAEPLYRRALAITEKALGPDHASVGADLNNLAVLLKTTGRYVEAEALYRRALAITEKALGPDHADVGGSLNNLAALLETTGRYAEAAPLYRRALAITEKALGPDHADVGNRLNNLAGLLQTTGRYAEAEPLTRRALAITEKALGPDHASVGADLNNLAVLLQTTGRYAEAEPLYRRTLAITEKALGPDHAIVGAALNNLAGLLQTTGRYAEAEPLFRRALAITEKALGPDHADVGGSLNNLAALLQTTGRYAEVEPLFRRALAITEKALGPDHASVGTRLNNLAGLLYTTGRYAEAEPLYRRAYRIALNAGVPELSWNVQDNLRGFYQKDSPDLAIFYGKQAINTLQTVRGNLKGLDKDTQKSFLGTVEQTYQKLADLLIAQGRLPEARQALKMLKEDEYRDFIRRSQDAQAQGSRIAYTGAERPWAEEGEAIAQEGIRLAAAIKPLEEAKKRGLSADEERQLTALLAARKTLGERFDRWYAGLAKELPIASKMLAEESRRAQETAMAEARAQVSRQGQYAALIEYLMVGDRLHILLTTPQRSLARQVDIDGKTIHRKLVDFRQALESAGYGGSGKDPRPLGKELYDALIAPVAVDLQADGTRTVMLSLEGALRYIPFAALYDGERYLIERYALSMHTAAGKRNDVAAQGPLKVAALGTTAAHEGFNALPGVKREMDILFKEAGLSGDVHLDQRFTAEQLHLSLNKRYPVLHVASHFQFTPGNEADSFLLLGDGKHLSLMELREGNYPFQGLDLLTLSACETAMEGGREANGREVEGFGALAQNKGAGAVLATLWSIADASTPDLMKAFYRQRTNGVDKAEALRQAQLALLTGKVDAGETAERGKVRTFDGQQAADTFTRDPDAPFAHPYYWAPFILMGNWL